MYAFLMEMVTTEQKAYESMKKFEDRGQGGIWITDDQAQLYLTADEATALWQWMSARPDTFQPHSHGTELEIRLYQKDLSHLSELEAVIPDLHELGPVAKVLNAPWEAVSERALQLIKAYRLEYHIHPMLEDEDTYAQ